MSTEKTSSATSRASHCYAAAGELYGHLRTSLGFGELVMFTRTWGQSAPPRVMAYQWTFNAKGERYCCEESVPFVELEHLRSIEAFAEHLSGRLKEQAGKSGSAASHCYAVGDRVRAKRTITAPADDELPAQHFCTKGDILIVRKVTDEKRPRNGVWPVYVSHEHITDRSFGLMLEDIEVSFSLCCIECDGGISGTTVHRSFQRDLY